MAYKVVYKKRFSNKLIKLLHYLEKEWGAASAEKFLLRTEQRIDMLKNYPLIGKASLLKPEIRSILLSRRNRIYYKVSGDEIIIMNMYDVRQNPKKNPYR